MRRIFFGTSVLSVMGLALLSYFIHSTVWLFVPVLFLISLGLIDAYQVRHAVRRNFPIIGRLRYFFEFIRPEINQYFVESNTSGRPLPRNVRSLIYQRAKGDPDTLPFGTQDDVYADGYEFAAHSLAPVKVDPTSLRVTIGGRDCIQPYSASLLNISGMAHGALSDNAVLALNGGAKLGNFAQNTGEGGLTSFHLEYGGDLILQVGTGYFGFRTPEGNFDQVQFAAKATHPNVKMIELKLSQGAKPAHGGLLPAVKLTRKIAEFRGVPMGQNVASPGVHQAICEDGVPTPLGLVRFLKLLRGLSGGKPVGFKLCVGLPHEFLAICKAMRQEQIFPDFITVDGGEGGTGAAPTEFSNSIGMPLTEGLLFVHNSLLGFGIRHHTRIICSGKITNGFDLVSRIAMGADLCNSARAMLMALGCIQALKCNTDRCPTGITTNDPALVAGLNVADKRCRVANYHRATIKAAADILGAMGLRGTDELRPRHIYRRVGVRVQTYSDLYEYVQPESFLADKPPDSFVQALFQADSNSFQRKLLRLIPGG